MILVLLVIIHQQRYDDLSVIEELFDTVGMMQQNSSGEGQIPESNATNEETNVVGLNRIDAKGNSSKKKDSICRWQEDHGITREVLEQQFDKSRDDAAKTLKGELTVQLYHISSNYSILSQIYLCFC